MDEITKKDVENIIYMNLSHYNFQKYEGMLEKDIPVESRCQSDKKLKRMLEYIHEQQEKKPGYLPAYALEMQITVRKTKENPKEYFAVECVKD